MGDTCLRLASVVPQNALIHKWFGVIAKEYAMSGGNFYTAEMWKEHLKNLFGYWEEFEMLGKTVRRLESTADYDVAEMSKFMDNLVRSRFTFVELMVVFAIIALLLSILYPSLNTAREQSRRALCKSNSQQIAQIINFYSGTYNGRISGEFGDVYAYARLLRVLKHLNIAVCGMYNIWKADTTFNYYSIDITIQTRHIYNFKFSG